MNIAGKASKASSQDQHQPLHYRYVTKHDIVIVTNYNLFLCHKYLVTLNTWRIIVDESKRLQGSKRTNEYSGQTKHSKFSRLRPYLRYPLGLTVGTSQQPILALLDCTLAILNNQGSIVYCVFYNKKCQIIAGLNQFSLHVRMSK